MQLTSLALLAVGSMASLRGSYTAPFSAELTTPQDVTCAAGIIETMQTAMPVVDTVSFERIGSGNCSYPGLKVPNVAEPITTSDRSRKVFVFEKLFH